MYTDKGSLARLIIAVLTALNTVLTAFGKPVIPDDLINAIVIIAGYLFEVYTMWRNNNITPEAVEAQKHLDKLKEEKKAE